MGKRDLLQFKLDNSINNGDEIIRVIKMISALTNVINDQNLKERFEFLLVRINGVQSNKILLLREIDKLLLNNSFHCDHIFKKISDWKKQNRLVKKDLYILLVDYNKKNQDMIKPRQFAIK